MENMLLVFILIQINVEWSDLYSYLGPLLMLNVGI